MFDTRQTLRKALHTTSTWYALCTTLHLTDPPMVTSAHDTHDTTGLHFQEHTRRPSATTGTITIDRTNGAFTVRAHTPSLRWHTALNTLGRLHTTLQDAPPSDPEAVRWEWQPYACAHPGALTGTLSLAPHLTVTTFIDHAPTPTSDRTYATSALTITPAAREHCLAVWTLGATFFGTFLTQDPTYRPTTPGGHPLHHNPTDDFNPTDPLDHDDEPPVGIHTCGWLPSHGECSRCALPPQEKNTVWLDPRDYDEPSF
ncbi:hypothetical protein JK364_24195 [Streptomyces sp. 110]|uniref:Uncharacterized protein n=1 Tax=Streptomyces endocoffeicus TaxID=2898945 RepID=A0ABS1PSR5_9ACTN|nr:hypothetical protein [Streptomyces endocoffeicus]MBL1115475.1 hypothetical protein [Streptomyces endocoffeicus]